MNKNKVTFLLVVIALVGFSSIPQEIGHYIQTDALFFRGTYLDTADYAVHISMMKAGRLGDWAYQMRFTSEEHSPAFIRLFYIFLGNVSRWLNLEVKNVFDIARWVFGVTALSMIYLLLQKMFSDTQLVFFTFFLSVLGSGIGWLQLILGAPLQPIAPIDFWLIDAYVLFSVSLFPSFSLTLSLMMLSLFIFLEFLENGSWKAIIICGLLAVISQMFNPIAFIVIDLAMAGAVVFTWWRSQKIEIKHIYALSILAIFQIPLLVYSFIVLAYDPIWSQFTFQNETLSPPFSFYFFGFFPFWFFAVIGSIQAIRERSPVIGAMFVWVISGFFLAYLPVLIQRRFLLGITIPLGILAIYGFNTLIGFVKLEGIYKRKNLFFFSYILLASVSSIFLILNSSLYVFSQPPQIFYARDLEDAAQWLNENAAPNDFVLASLETSQILAQQTTMKVYFGHEMETLYFSNKESEMKAYYKGTIADEWLIQTPIRWVVYGPYEKEITNTFTPSIGLFLVYQNETVKIYETSK